jgi:predicted glutamine amidotransferase
MTTGTPVEQSNCHPFRHGRWLFQHNGFIERYLERRREATTAMTARAEKRLGTAAALGSRRPDSNRGPLHYE